MSVNLPQLAQATGQICALGSTKVAEQVAVFTGARRLLRTLGSACLLLHSQVITSPEIPFQRSLFKLDNTHPLMFAGSVHPPLYERSPLLGQNSEYDIEINIEFPVYVP